jgi:type I restriction enzyme S subunit
MRETLIKSEEFKDSPVGRIPKDWEVVPLGSCIEFITDYRGMTPPYVNDGIAVISAENIGDGRVKSITKYVTLEVYKRTTTRGFPKPDDVIFTTEAPVGEIALLPGDRIYRLTRRVIALRPKQDILRKRFLYWYLVRLNTIGAWDSLRHGSTVPRILKPDILNYKILLPPPQEQDTIIQILDTLDAAIAHTSSLIAKLKQMKAGLLHDLLTRGLDENGELRDAIAHPEQFKDSPLGQIPKDWECGIAQLFCDGIVVGVVCNATDSYVDKGVPFLRSQNIRPNYIDTNGLLYISHTFNTLQSKSILHSGDVIIVRTGANTGMTAVVPESLEGANCFSLVVCRPNRAKLNSYFFSHYLNSESCQALMDRTHFGSAQHNFNIGEMNRLLIAVPPLEEQAEIVCRIEAHNTRIRTEEAYREKLKLQKQGLMHDLLTGKVRVKDA